MKDNGGSAFPSKGSVWNGKVADDAGTIKIFESVELQGLSIRDYFAAKVMQGYIANDGFCEPAHMDAKLAYKWADAMIEERKKP